MRRNRATWAVCALVAAVGCHTAEKYDTRVPVAEEFRSPPDEARFNNPPEKGYKKPPPKKDFKPAIGTGGMGSGMMNNGAY